MNYQTIRQTLENAFKTGWSVTPIAYTNTPALIDESEWVRISIINIYSSNSAIGETRTLKTGYAVIQIFIPLDTGTGRADELADLANTILENKRWGDLFTYAGYAQPVGESPSTLNLGADFETSTPGFYQVNLKIPYEANS